MGATPLDPDSVLDYRLEQDFPDDDYEEEEEELEEELEDEDEED